MTIITRWALSKRVAVAGLLLGATLGSTMVRAAEDDPWEGVNRGIFRFNDVLDTYAFKPIAKGYRFITPQFVQNGIHNLFENVGDVGNLANDLLQGKPHDAGVDTARLLVNTTIGLGGLVDVGTSMGLVRNDEDFGQTLGKWGVPSGPFVMLPFLGPSNVRDGVAKIPDNHATLYPYLDDIALRNSLFAIDMLDTRAQLLPAEKLIAGDKYIFIRNAYMQMREFNVKDGQVEDDF